MEQINKELFAQISPERKRAINLRQVARASDSYISRRAGDGYVLNELLSNYPEHHPATTLSFMFDDEEWVTLAIDIANHQDITNLTGDDYYQAIMFGADIVHAKRLKYFNWGMNPLSLFATKLLISREGRLDFSPIIDPNEIDPFKKLNSIWDISNS